MVYYGKVGGNTAKGAKSKTGGYKTSLRKISQLQILCVFPQILYSFSQLKTFMFKIAKGYDSVSKTIRIHEPVAERLETLAAENNISLNQLVNQCIHFALEHLYIGEYSPNDNAGGKNDFCTKICNQK